MPRESLVTESKKDPNQFAVCQEYRKLAPDHDARWGKYVDITLSQTIDRLELSGNERVLDVPCGTGELVAKLLEKWPRLTIVGADASAAMLTQARTKLRDNRVKWVEAVVPILPFEDDQFDLVICANSFHYFRDPDASLFEFRRILSSRGQLVIVDWCDDYLTCKLCSLWLRLTSPAFFKTYTLKACEQKLSDAGLKVDSAEHFRADWLWGMMALHSSAS